MFTLEALRARHGDCLILNWGESDQSMHHALIDGGPDLTYSESLRPRLVQLAKASGVDQIKLDLTMVSHIDDDHINGILDLTDEIENGDAPADIDILWHNSLEGLLKHKIDEDTVNSVTSALQASPPTTVDHWYAKVLASVPQGQRLHAFAKRHGIDHRMNEPYSPLVMLQDDAEDAEFSGLKIKVLGPTADELENLRKKWKELCSKSITAAYADRSPYNLSSIIVMAEYKGRRALLTGDARGDRVIGGLERRKLLDKDGKIHVNLLKIMHHGSQNNATEEFYETIIADTYVVSGDHEKFPNPHKTAMQWLADVRGDDDYKVYCTYDLKYMRDIFGDKLVVPADGKISVTAKI